jgi:hypothetical protein
MIMRKLWNWFSGKKTTIATAYWTAMLPAVKIIYDTGVPDDVELILGGIGLALSFLGLGHKAAKNIAIK